jgi:hypothetical protein
VQVELRTWLLAAHPHVFQYESERRRVSDRSFCYHNRMPLKKIFLSKSRNNIDVWYDAITSHVATHLEDTPNLGALAAQVIEHTNISKPYMQFHVDMGYVVGSSDLVENEQDDEIIYAKRLNRDEFTAFNKSKPPQPSSLITVALEQQDDGTYELVSAWVGPSNSPSFPGTERETPDSKGFWKKHSLAWGNQAVQPGSVTTICPW